MRFILTSIFFTILVLLPHLTAAAPSEFISHRYVVGEQEVPRPNRDWARPPPSPPRLSRPPPPPKNNVAKKACYKLRELNHERKLKTAEKEVKEHKKNHQKSMAQGNTSRATVHSNAIEQKRGEARKHAAKVDDYRVMQGQPRKYADYNPPR